jgi:hypothetical protein
MSARAIHRCTETKWDTRKSVLTERGSKVLRPRWGGPLVKDVRFPSYDGCSCGRRRTGGYRTGQFSNTRLRWMA